MITTKNQLRQIKKVRPVIDAETGEQIPALEISQDMQEKDFNFHKLWFGHFIQSLDSITNKRLKLAFWIIDHLDSNNKLIMSTTEIAAATGISQRTVASTMKLLQEGPVPFLKKLNTGGGAYMVNPDIVFKGAYGRRMAVLYDYGKAGASVTDIATKRKGKGRKAKEA